MKITQIDHIQQNLTRTRSPRGQYDKDPQFQIEIKKIIKSGNIDEARKEFQKKSKKMKTFYNWVKKVEQEQKDDHNPRHKKHYLNSQDEEINLISYIYSEFVKRSISPQWEVKNLRILQEASREYLQKKLQKDITPSIKWFNSLKKRYSNQILFFFDGNLPNDSLFDVEAENTYVNNETFNFETYNNHSYQENEPQNQLLQYDEYQYLNQYYNF